LANGILERLPFGAGLPVHGPGWRKPGADEHAKCHVLALDGGDFLVSDGSNGLTRLHWSEPKSWEKKASVQLPARIATPPVVAGKSIVVACANHSLIVLDDAGLTVSRSWALPGPVTNGPFAHDQGIGCVVGHNRLVWIDPARKQPWEYSLDARIVGVPLWSDGMLVVANQAGQIDALSPKDGQALGSYALHADVAPAAAPISFGDGQLFLPLSDGTVFVMPRKRLR